MHRRLLLLPLLAVLAAIPLPAAADDLASVRAKVATAMQSAKSFVVTTAAATGFNVTLTFVAPDRYHSTLAYGGASRDIVLIGAVAYVTDDGQTYRKTDAPPEVIAAEAQLRAVPVDQMLPDTTAGGKTWGQFVTTSAGPQKDQRLTCTYDKATYRLNVCANAGLSVAFSRYDDPRNVVDVPAVVAPPSPAAH